MEIKKIFLWNHSLAVWVCIALCVLPWRVSAATSYYVTPSGAGDYGGTNWHNAYSNMQAAATLATNAGDAIYLQSGVYSNASQIVISNAAGVMIYGGCYGGGGGNSNVYSGTNSMLTRTGGVMRIVYGQASTVTVAGVTISGGYFTNGANNGAGLYFTNCAVTLTNCAIVNNVINSASDSSYGAGLYVHQGSLVIADCLITNNRNRVTANVNYCFGGGIYFSGATLVMRNTTNIVNAVTNVGNNGGNCLGGALYCSAASVQIVNSLFDRNAANSGNDGTGSGSGAIYLTGGAADIANCIFTNNYATTMNNQPLFGGALGAYGVSPLNLVSNAFRCNYLITGSAVNRGGTIYAAGGITRMESCDLRDNIAAVPTARGDICLAGGVLALTNCLIVRSVGDGLLVASGTATLFNCLLAANSSDGLRMTNGAVTVVNCTLADNAGWGINRTAGTGNVLNCIAWGNGSGGITSNSSVNVSYSCSQNSPYGSFNQTNNPMFVYAYYLSVSNLPGQTESSPCLDAGSDTAASFGLTNRTTRTDGSNDSGLVDLGYHYTNGVDSGVLSNATLYVDAVNGSDTNTGLSAGAALKTMTNALAKVIRDGTIYVATGTYNTANGEVFPLTVATPALRIIGAGREATLFDASSSGRVFYARNQGVIRLEGLTFRNGYLASSDNGAGLYFFGCSSVTLTNCAILNNVISSASDSSYGAGLYVHQGSLVIADCLITNNRNRVTATVNYCFGGGIYFSGATLAMRNTTNIANAVTNVGMNGGNCLGGALYCSAASAQIINSLFDRNAANSGNDSTGSGSGAIYLTGGAADIALCVFTNNYATTMNNNPLYGGALAAYGVNPLNLVSNAFRCNYLITGNALNRGGTIYAAGGITRMESCDLRDNIAAVPTARGDICLAGGVLALTNCLIVKSTGDGLLVASGTATLFNCLLAANSSDGLHMTNGAASLVNCTLADNAGWGINRTAGTGNVLNCIAWANGSGGITSNSSVNVSYSCSQNSPYGSFNQTNNPMFVYAYYLSVSNLPGQTESSPCLDAGSDTAASFGLTNRTTRTDGSNDSGLVDLGCHYTNGVDSGVLSNATLYVDAMNGSDTNTGLSAGAALKTMTNALAKVIRDGTIFVATGLYNAANGEVFPLTVATPALRIIGAGREATLFDAGSSVRVFYALNKGDIRLERLTFRNGYLATGDNGAGLYLFGNVSVTLSNCAIVNNLISFSSGSSYGAGVYCYQGSLTVADCLITNNRNRATNNVDFCYGGGIYFSGATLAMRNTTNIANAVTNVGMNGGNCIGGALYCSAVSAQIVNSLFDRNYAACGNGAGSSGCIYFNGGAADIANCVFTNNWATALNSQPMDGGVLGVYGVSPLNLVSNEFRDNYLATANATPRGGTFYVTACSTMVVDCCTIDGSGISAGTAPEQVYVTGGLSAQFLNSILRNNSPGRGLTFVGGAGSSLVLTNCLVVKNASDGLRIAGGTATVVNCTLANNTGWGIARPTSAGLTVKNSIFWGNMFGGIGHNQNLVLTYTDSQDAWSAGMGVGNMSQDPLFVDPAAGDFHEMSPAGSWHGGLWAPDGHMSPCIDAGEPAPGSPYALEHKPTGGRINMGAYGNTAQSSLSSRGTVVMVW